MTQISNTGISGVLQLLSFLVPLVISIIPLSDLNKHFLSKWTITQPIYQICLQISDSLTFYDFPLLTNVLLSRPVLQYKYHLESCI